MQVQKHEKAAKNLCSSIDIDVLLRGTGSKNHERELHKFLAAADINSEDLKKGETMELIQGFIAEFLVDQELQEGEDEFLA